MGRFDGFIGPSYQPSAYSLDTQVTRNWYLETVESGKGKSPYGMLRTPGRRVFCDPGLGPTAVRGLYSLNGHAYAVIGQRFVEIFADRSFKVYPTVIEGNDTARIVGNQNQIFIVAGKNGYIAQAGTVQQITDSTFPTGKAVGATFMDGYFAVSVEDSDVFQLCNLQDGLNWSNTFQAEAEGAPDNIVMHGALNQEFWPFGSQTTQVFDDTGALDMPWEPSSSDILIQNGLWAPGSLTDVAGSWYFIEGSQRGHGMVMRMSAYTPSRVSNHPIEEKIAAMTDSTDCISWTYEENGHNFMVNEFPSADKTIVYDVATGQWHERSWFSGGVEHAIRSRYAMSAFGKILVGDRVDGKIYEQSMKYLDDDNGDLIKRTRIAPCIDEQLLNVVHGNFVLDGNMGLGLSGITDRDDPNYDPQMVLRFSNDGGKTYGSEHWRGFGVIGEFRRRAIWRRLGYARRRVYWSEVTAPVDWAISGCYVNMKLGGKNGG